MVTIQQATENAVAFARASLGDERTRGIRLEEVESAKEHGNEAWRITLSIPASDPISPLPAIFSYHREYKSFTVLKDTGEVTSMKIREISNA